MAILMYVFLFAISMLNGIALPDDPADWHIDITNYALFELVCDRNELDKVIKPNLCWRQYARNMTLTGSM